MKMTAPVAHAGMATGLPMRAARASTASMASTSALRSALPSLKIPASSRGMGLSWSVGRAERLRVHAEADDEPQPSSPGYAIERSPATAASLAPLEEEKTDIQKFLFPDPEELPDDLEMSIWDHFEELRERVIVATVGCGIAIGGSFLYSKDLVKILETPVAREGVRFLALSPGEYFFTTFKVSGYTGLLIGVPLIMYEVIAFVLPGLTQSERKFLGPIVFGSSVLFYIGLAFSYSVLAPAALKFFVSYADGAVDSLWSIDQYFEFILVLMLSTGLSFQVPVIQVLLGQLGVVSSQQMLSIWRYVVVGAVVVAAVLTPSTDPFTQTLLAAPLIALYVGGAFVVKALETSKLARGEE